MDAVAIQADDQPVPHRWLALTVLCVPLLIVSLDNTVLNVVLPTLVRDLHATTNELQWIVDTYVMVYAGLLLAVGSVADRVGRKRTFLIGLVVFAGASAGASYSGSVGLLIAARAGMGIGGALMMPSTLAIITNMFHDPAERRGAIGAWSGTTGLGIALGPIVGGALLSHFWWGSVFLINVPIVLVGLVFALPLVPESRNPEAPRPDVIGAPLSIAGLGLVLWALIEAPVHGWSSALVLGVGAGGLAVLAAFVAWELISTHPMLNLRFFANRRFSAAILSTALVTFGLFGALFLLTQFLQFHLSYTALQTGVRVLPAAGAVVVAAALSPLLIRVSGTKLTAAAGLLAIAGGLWQISGATASTTYTDILPGMILLGAGMGLVIPSATESVVGTLPSGDTGVGSAATGTFLQVGGALGVAVIGSLLATRYQDTMTSGLASSHIPPSVMNTISGSLGGALGAAHQVGGSQGMQIASLAQSAFVSGMDLGLRTGAAVAAGGCLVALIALPARSVPSSERTDYPRGQQTRADQPDSGSVRG